MRSFLRVSGTRRTGWLPGCGHAAARGLTSPLGGFESAKTTATAFVRPSPGEAGKCRERRGVSQGRSFGWHQFWGFRVMKRSTRIAVTFGIGFWLGFAGPAQAPEGVNSLAGIFQSAGAGELGEEDLLRLEARPQEISSQDDNSKLRAQAHLIDVYSLLADAAESVANNEFLSRKGETVFNRLRRTAPDHVLAYANHAVSLASAPDFLQSHRMSQESSENALDKTPRAVELRTADDWNALALVVRFCSSLLEKADHPGMTEAEAGKRRDEILSLATQLREG